MWKHMGPHIFSLISIRKSVKFLQAELISFRFGHSDVPATCHRICRAGSIFLFVCLPEPWNYLMIFNIFLLIVSLIWYEVPGAKKLAAKSTKLKVKDLDILAKRMGVNAEIYVMDLQNLGAFQIGAKGKYVFLTKKLVKTLKKEELMSMVAHEFAHIKLRHVLKKVLSTNRMSPTVIPIPFSISSQGSTKIVQTYGRKYVLEFLKYGGCEAKKKYIPQSHFKNLNVRFLRQGVGG